MKRASLRDHALVNALDYAWICAFAVAAGTVSGLAWGWFAGALVGTGFLAVCIWVHWLAHRIIARSRRTSEPQRQFPGGGR